ncbi:hypothetical protein BFW38_07885 [Terasakiispira papahanaumokuakeensis]|uniref:STAS/SEC14 domain-containing protein n=1 Tax=Terasakiispira papahanaumokuakeensis TaxID=197479 RepID=A0A1E2V923_9GAMM|nr:STAS/SEC14 domain-containing protein [Terasakiispira papahanaumokuakeensis]ODC03477.1 hypothetical protein BFW38_07885 [Terasakiispira papahanaumokuakeensis]
MSAPTILKRHGLTVGVERIDDRIFVSMKAIGTLSHDDFDQVTPMLDSALGSVRSPEVDVLMDATQFEGWEARALWDDFKLGLKHGSKFRRIAIVGNREWQERLAKIGDWFMTGQVRYFELIEEALNWLNTPPLKSV